MSSVNTMLSSLKSNAQLRRRSRYFKNDVYRDSKFNATSNRRVTIPRNNSSEKNFIDFRPQHPKSFIAYALMIAFSIGLTIYLYYNIL